MTCCVASGMPEPLGPSAGGAGGAAGVNFALWAGDATGVTLVVADADDAAREIRAGPRRRTHRRPLARVPGGAAGSVACYTATGWPARAGGRPGTGAAGYV